VSKRRRWIALGLVNLAVVLAVGWRMMPRTGPRLQVENYQFVQRGMTLPEVEALLGGPPGNYGQYPNGATSMTCEGVIYSGMPTLATERVWCDDNTRYEIFFDPQDDRVLARHQRSYKQEPGESLFGWLLRQFGL
jgi:hypothetical protein